jgi:hypothetical protein
MKAKRKPAAVKSKPKAKTSKQDKMKATKTTKQKTSKKKLILPSKMSDSVFVKFTDGKSVLYDRFSYSLNKKDGSIVVDWFGPKTKTRNQYWVVRENFNSFGNKEYRLLNQAIIMEYNGKWQILNPSGGLVDNFKTKNDALSRAIDIYKNEL